MGLPLAPELARMATAYLLRLYLPPPNERLIIYFDDIAATYPVDARTQDCTYDHNTRKFIPLQQLYRQPVLLHPQSYHPSKNMAKNTYVSTAFRLTKTSTDPSDCLNLLLRKYLPALVRKGHSATDTVKKLFKFSYFPTHSEKKEREHKPLLRYTFTQTRPTKQQMLPIEIKDYHLIPSLPLAPLKASSHTNRPTKHQHTIGNIVSRHL